MADVNSLCPMGCIWPIEPLDPVHRCGGLAAWGEVPAAVVFRCSAWAINNSGNKVSFYLLGTAVNRALQLNCFAVVKLEYKAPKF